MTAKSLCFIALLTYISLSGCAGAALKEDGSEARPVSKHEDHPRIITEGTYAPLPASAPPGNATFVVWGKNPMAVHRALALVKKAGNPIIDQSRLQAFFDEHKIQLKNTPEDRAEFIRAGRLIGAGRIMFVVVIMRLVSGQSSADSSIKLYRVTVAVQTSMTEDGTIRWTGVATLTNPITNPEDAIGELTEVAIRRGTCPTDKGHKWIEQGPSGSKWGCVPPETK